MEKNKVLHIGKWLLIVFFVALICLDIYLAYQEQDKFDYRKTILILTFIAVIQFKNRFTWILGTSLFLWSLYYIIIKSVNAAVPTFYEFTDTLFFLINPTVYPKLHFFVHGLPVYFNFLALIVFSTYPVRRWYKISSKKAPKIRPYL